jgi:hypothetical protein
MSNTRMRSLIAGIVAALLTGAMVAGLYKVTEIPAATPSNLPPEKTQAQVTHSRGGISNDANGALHQVSWGRCFRGEGDVGPIARLPVYDQHRKGAKLQDRCQVLMQPRKCPESRAAISLRLAATQWVDLPSRH